MGSHIVDEDVLAPRNGVIEILRLHYSEEVSENGHCFEFPHLFRAKVQTRKTCLTYSNSSKLFGPLDLSKPVQKILFKLI